MLLGLKQGSRLFDRSEEFEIGGFVWNLLIFPKGNPGSKKVPAAIQDRSLAVYLNAPRCAFSRSRCGHRS